MVVSEKKRQVMKRCVLGLLALNMLSADVRIGEIKQVLDEILAYHVDEHVFSSKRK